MLRRALIVLAAAAVAAGPAAASLSPGDYRKQANALCAKTNKAVNAIPSPKSAKELTGYVKSVHALQKPFVTAFARLSPPGSLRSLHAKSASLNRQDLANIEDLISMLEDGEDPNKAITEIAKREDPLTKTEAANYKKLGLPACADLVD